MKQINLPSLPSSWESLTGRQMIEINRLRRLSKSEQEFYFRVFCYLSGIVQIHGVVYSRKGSPLFCFRQVGPKGKPCGESFHMEAWQVHEAVGQYLSWLSTPCNRVSQVLPLLTMPDGRSFSDAGYAMTKMTYQQHQYAQRYFSEIQRTEIQLTHEYFSDSPDKERMSQLIDYLRRSRRLFMATVYTPPCHVSSKTVDGKMVVYDIPQTDYVFGTGQIHREEQAFSSVAEEIIDATLQHFHGVMLHYQRIYPKLFKEGAAGNTDPIRVEESTLNILQSELKFSNYQTIYDSNAPFILGKLHAIILKGEEIERMNSKMKH